MLKMKKKIVTSTNQTKLMSSNVVVSKPRMGSIPATIAPRVTFTICVKGKTARARP